METLGWISLGTVIGSFTLWVCITDQSTRIRQLLAGLGLPEDPLDDPRV